LGSYALRRYFPYLLPYWRLVVIMGVAAAAALGAAAGIPQVIKLIIDGPVTHKHIEQLIPFGLLLVLLAVVELIGNFTRRTLSGVASFNMETDLRNDFYAHLQALQVSFHDNWQSGQLLSRAIADINTVRRFVGFGLVFAAVFIATFLTVVAMLFTLNVPLALLTTAAAIPVIFLSRRFFRLYGVIARRVQDQQGDLTTVIEEAATGVRIIKAFGRMPLMLARFKEQAGKLQETNLLAVRTRGQMWTMLSFVPNVNLGLVVLIGGFAVLGGRMSIGALVAFISYLFMLIWPMEAIGWIMAMGEEANTAATRLSEVFDSIPDIKEHPGAIDLVQCEGRIRFEDVGFRYPGSGEWILRHVDLEVAPGETLAVVGRTGSGKTTLVSLMPRLYDVTEGRITLDGTDIREIKLRSLRQHIGVAFEDPILFSASVYENLLMGRAAQDDQEMKRAIEVAQAGFVWELPWGLETRVGEQGYTLSGGQRQRLALARAVLGRPQVLVLDDPLSSVDVHTEAVIEEALASVLKGVTALLVVHRPSTLALADRVALLDGGRITAVGTHTELMEGNDLYRALLSQEFQEVAT
jgi:ATP-binding cassette subfamily B protein